MCASGNKPTPASGRTILSERSNQSWSRTRSPKRHDAVPPEYPNSSRTKVCVEFSVIVCFYGLRQRRHCYCYRRIAEDSNDNRLIRLESHAFTIQKVAWAAPRRCALRRLLSSKRAPPPSTPRCSARITQGRYFQAETQ